MNKTQIEWVKNPDGTQGYTFNPITGCLNHTNGLCKGGGFPCYAYRLANGRLRQRYLQNSHLAKREIYQDSENLYCIGDHDPFYPRFWPERLNDIIRGYHYSSFGTMSEFAAKPRGVFVCDMSDLFGIGIPDDWTKQVLSAINDWGNRLDRFYLLTKQPQNLIKWSPFPDNCWVGVTATNAKMLREALMYLEEVRASVKYVSLEPLLERIYDPLYFLNALPDFLSILDWLIIGAQTRPTVYPKIEWVEEIVQAADRVRIPVFLKDNLLELVNYVDKKTEFAFKDGYYRQELPEKGKL